MNAVLTCKFSKNLDLAHKTRYTVCNLHRISAKSYLITVYRHCACYFCTPIMLNVVLV